MKLKVLCIVVHDRDHHPEQDPMAIAKDELWKQLGRKPGSVKLQKETLPLIGGDPNQAATVVVVSYED